MKQYQLISFSEISKMLAEHLGVQDEEQAFSSFACGVLNHGVELDKILPCANVPPEQLEAINGLAFCLYNLNARSIELDFEVLKDRQLIFKHSLGEYAKQEICKNSMLSDEHVANFVNWNEYGYTLINPYINCDKYYLLEEKPQKNTTE